MKKIVLIFCLMYVSEVYADIIASGNNCGANCFWTLDKEGNLSITGSGTMKNFSRDEAPWQEKMSEIKNVSIDDRITSIGEYAFNGATNLISANIPTSATRIGSYSFSNTLNLTSINIPNVVTTIDGSAFGGSGLINLDIPSSVTTINGGAFSGTKNLKSVHIAENSSLKTISGRVFAEAINLESINIPSSVISIGNSAFYGANSLKNVNIEADSALKSIGNYSFTGAKSLITLNLPNTIDSIGSFAFSKSALKEISIPDNVTFIGDHAFYDSDQLTSIIFSEKSKLEYLGTNTFLYASALETIILPPNFQFEAGTMLNLQYTDNLQNLYLTPEQAQNVSFTGKSSTFAPLVYQIGTDGVMVSQNGREIYKYDSLTQMLDGTDWLERYEYSDDRKYGGLRQEAFAKDGDGEKYLGAKIYRPDGSIVLVDENNKFINKLHAKIYTVEEAMAVTRDGNVNRVRLTYK